MLVLSHVRPGMVVTGSSEFHSVIIFFFSYDFFNLLSFKDLKTLHTFAITEPHHIPVGRRSVIFLILYRGELQYREFDRKYFQSRWVTAASLRLRDPVACTSASKSQKVVGM